MRPADCRAGSAAGLAMAIFAATSALANKQPESMSRPVTWCLAKEGLVASDEAGYVTVSIGQDGIVAAVILSSGAAVRGPALTCVKVRFERAGWRESNHTVTVPLDASMAVSSTLPPVFEAIRTRDHSKLRRLTADASATAEVVTLPPVWLDGFDMRGGVPSPVAMQHGVTALHFAVSQRDPVSVAILLAAGASPKAATKEGITPLDLAKRLQYREIEALLMAQLP